MLDILVKTQRKMSPLSRAQAHDFGLPGPVLALYELASKAADAATRRQVGSKLFGHFGRLDPPMLKYEPLENWKWLEKLKAPRLIRTCSLRP